MRASTTRSIGRRGPVHHTHRDPDEHSVSPATPAALPQALRLSNNQYVVIKRLALVGAVAVLLTGCSGNSEPTAADTKGGQTTNAPSSGPETEQKGVCPATLPNGSVPPDTTADFWGSSDSHGNGKLWTLLWPYGVVVAPDEWIEKDGSIGVKWPWYRGVPGKLKIEGRRLDATAPPLRADLSTADSYGESGFQPSGIYFSTEGCWEVTGKVGGATLTFVTVVVKASTYALELKTE